MGLFDGMKEQNSMQDTAEEASVVKLGTRTLASSAFLMTEDPGAGGPVKCRETLEVKDREKTLILQAFLKIPALLQLLQISQMILLYRMTRT